MIKMKIAGKVFLSQAKEDGDTRAGLCHVITCLFNEMYMYSAALASKLLESFTEFAVLSAGEQRDALQATPGNGERVIWALTTAGGPPAHVPGRRGSSIPQSQPELGCPAEPVLGCSSPRTPHPPRKVVFHPALVFLPELCHSNLL